MKIISKFKDYYDFVSFQYGADEKVTYVRNTIDKSLWNHEDIEINRYPRTKINGLQSMAWLVVCGKYYLVIKDIYYKDEYTVLTEVSHPEIYKDIIKHNNFKDFNGKHSKALDILSRRINQPVFIVHPMGWRKHCRVEDKIPKLSDFEFFTKNFTAFEIWQEIYSYMSNVMRDNPDINPPVELSNNDKITKAGFDLKTSFRGGNKK